MASLDKWIDASMRSCPLSLGGHALKESSSGTPSASAQCTCANAGGFEMMASAANERAPGPSGS